MTSFEIFRLVEDSSVVWALKDSNLDGVQWNRTRQMFQRPVGAGGVGDVCLSASTATMRVIDEADLPPLCQVPEYKCDFTLPMSYADFVAQLGIPAEVLGERPEPGFTATAWAASQGLTVQIDIVELDAACAKWEADIIEKMQRAVLTERLRRAQSIIKPAVLLRSLAGTTGWRCS